MIKKLEAEKKRLLRRIDKLNSDIVKCQDRLIEIDLEVKEIEELKKQNSKLKDNLKLNSQKENHLLSLLERIQNGDYVSTDEFKSLIQE